MTNCRIHKTVKLLGTADALGGPVGQYCPACYEEKKAVRLFQLAEKSRDRGDNQAYFRLSDRARNANNQCVEIIRQSKKTV